MKNKFSIRSEKAGTFDMLAASVLFATGGFVLKWVPWNSLAINGIRSVFGALVLALFLLVTRRRLRFNRTILFGALAYTAMTTLFVMANKMAGAANAIVLQFTSPIWIILINLVFFRKKPARREWAAVLLVLAGIACFFFDSLSFQNIAGNLTAILSGICYAIMFIQNSLKDGDALSSVFFGQILGFLLMGGFVLQESDFAGSVILAVIWLGAFQVGLAYIFFCLGTRKIDPLQACLITGLEPILNPLFVTLVWGDTISPLSLLGAVIVIATIVAYSALPLLQSRKTASASA